MNILWWRKARQTAGSGIAPEERLRQKYQSLRELLTLNNESLELMAGLQEDLQYVPPRRAVVEARVAAIYQKASLLVGALERITGREQPKLAAAVDRQRLEVGRYVSALQEFAEPRLAASLSELVAKNTAEAGGKAAVLGEIKTRLGLPVPDGFVATTEAYRQFCGIPRWREIRDALRQVEPAEPEGLRAASASLSQMVIEQALPRAVEVAITERARQLSRQGVGLAVRSSSVGEGGEAAGRTFAGQFLTLLNVPVEEVAEAYKRVVAARFSEQALFYRLSNAVFEVDSPMAVLFLPMIRARAAGVMYTRDPAAPKSRALWITATRGLGLEIASGHTPADLFVLARRHPHELLDRQLVRKTEQLVELEGGGLAHRPIPPAEMDAPSLTSEQLRLLAHWGVRLERHFGVPQDIEWAVDEEGKLWILQARPLGLVEPAAMKAKAKAKAKEAPVLEGGRTIYPGRVSGPAYLAEDVQAVRAAPSGAIVFVRRPSPELVPAFSRIGGLVAEWGNVAGHAAALLREYKVPSVFLMAGAFDRLKTGSQVSLDAVQSKVYPGSLWPPRAVAVTVEHLRRRAADPISMRLLTLNLMDPSSVNFRPSGCKSTHDVLRFCHEKAVEAMFQVNDVLVGHESRSARKLRSSLPVDIHVLDLGGGVMKEGLDAQQLEPGHVLSRPFQPFWKGITHPDVTWTREMPASLSDLASVLATSLAPPSGKTRGLGEKNYLLVADEYLNFNSRLAFHFTLVDACLSDSPSKNYISFRFAGGGATWERRSLRACFIESCLTHYGFRTDRRGDLVNAWYKRGSSGQTAERLDILGRLIACTCQLDMYMANYEVMKWYVRQFLEGNYSFRPDAGNIAST